VNSLPAFARRQQNDLQLLVTGFGRRPFGVIFSSRVSGLAVLEKRRRLFVIVTGDEIVVTSDAGFRAAYCRRPHHPQLIIRRRTDTDDHEMIAQAWQAANDKARELGWIGTPITHFPVKRRRP
jgi:hypothetical protein